MISLGQGESSHWVTCCRFHGDNSRDVHGDDVIFWVALDPRLKGPRFKYGAQLEPLQTENWDSPAEDAREDTATVRGAEGPGTASRAGGSTWFYPPKPWHSFRKNEELAVNWLWGYFGQAPNFRTPGWLWQTSPNHWGVVISQQPFGGVQNPQTGTTSWQQPWLGWPALDLQWVYACLHYHHGYLTCSDSCHSWDGIASKNLRLNDPWDMDASSSLPCGNLT